MVGQKFLNAYRKTERQAEMKPVKLIHMLYERALYHLGLAEEGIAEASPKKRGENLSKAIAIVSELNASIRSEDQSEAAGFLRGLYTAILIELPKVAVSGDTKTLRQSRNYLEKLKDIWEQTAMREAGEDLHPQVEEPLGLGGAQEEANHGYGSSARSGVGSLSVSI